jgi:hypothetical protein
MGAEIVSGKKHTFNVDRCDPFVVVFPPGYCFVFLWMGTECWTFLLSMLQEACQLSLSATGFNIRVAIARSSVIAVTKFPDSGQAGKNANRSDEKYFAAFVKNRDTRKINECDVRHKRLSDSKEKQTFRKNSGS